MTSFASSKNLLPKSAFLPSKISESRKQGTGVLACMTLGFREKGPPGYYALLQPERPALPWVICSQLSFKSRVPHPTPPKKGFENCTLIRGTVVI